MSFSIGPVSLRMTASEAITAITDKLGQSAGEEIQKRYSNNSLNSIFWEMLTRDGGLFYPRYGS